MQPAASMVPPTMSAPPQYQQQWMPPQTQHQQPQYQQPMPAHSYYYQQQPPQQQRQQHQSQPQLTSADEIRSLWVGDLQYWMEENYLYSCFAQSGEVTNVKIIRNKQTNEPEGYGFIEFASHDAAERNLQAFNGVQMPNAEQTFRLNWASYGAGEKRTDDTPDYSIFVGDLAADVTDYMLQETFRARYPSVRSAKVVTDRVTGRTKGYGFVKFVDESEQLSAMSEMNGKFCSTRPMRIGPAANKKSMGASYQNSHRGQSEEDPSNTTIFVGNLDSNITDEHLRQVFGQYGQLLHVKIPVGKRCGFVQFAERSSAEEALRTMNGQQLGGQSIRLSWGHSPLNKQPQADPNTHGGAGYYSYAPGYEASYGYAPAAHDPNLYYAGYPGYGNYPPPPQQQQQQNVQQSQ